MTTTTNNKGFWSFSGCLEHFNNKQEVVDYILSLEPYRRPLEGRIVHFLSDYTIYEAATFSMATGEMVVSKCKRYARY